MKSVINIKADKEIKESAQKLAGELGLSLSAVINAYLRQFIQTKSVAFSATSKMTEKLENSIAKIESDIKEKKNISGPFSAAEDAIKHLDSLS